MHQSKKTQKLSLAFLCASSFSLMENHTAVAADWTFSPALTLTETYTDNVNLDSAESQSDFVTQLTPIFELQGTGPRLQTTIFYGPNYFYYPGDDSDKHDLRHNLQSSLSGELVNDFFFVDAGANINQQFLDRRDAITSETVSRTNNRRTVQTYRVSPYLVNNFGSWVTTTLRYDFSYLRQNAEESNLPSNVFIGNSVIHQGSLSIASGRKFSRLHWDILSYYQTEDRQDQRDFETVTSRLSLSYQLNRMLALLGSAGYQKRKTGGTFAEFDGFIWDAGFRLVPGPRTSLSVRYGNQSTGDTFSLNARYKITAKNSINLSYSDTIQTYQSLAFDTINDPGFVVAPLDGNFLSNNLTRRKRWALSLSGERGRTSYNLSGFISDIAADNEILDEKRYGASVYLSRRLNSRLSLSSGFSYNLSRFRNDGVDDRFWSASVSADYQLSQSLLGAITYVHSDRNQSRLGRFDGGSNYISLSIRADF